MTAGTVENTQQRLSTTSEGLWLTAALCGATALPPALKIRPIGAVTETVATHPGLADLARAGVYVDGAVDADVAEWIKTLTRPDIEVDVSVAFPQETASALVGPVEVPRFDGDAVHKAAQLAAWHASKPPERLAALCRRHGQWVAALRMWSNSEQMLDEVTVTPLGTVDAANTVGKLIPTWPAAKVVGINCESAVLKSALQAYQTDPERDVIADLAAAGLSAGQARIVAAVADRTARRTTVSACQFALDGVSRVQHGVAIVDTVFGRVVITTTVGPDGRQWTTLLPGHTDTIREAVEELLRMLPAGREWGTYERI